MIILGGGLAGLAASMVEGAPVYEASDSVGGVAGSQTVDGFTFDYGIHVLQTDHKVIHQIFDDVGIRLGTRVRDAHIYSHGRYTAYPFQVNTAGLPVRLRTNCVWNYLRRPKNSSPRNYQDWIYNSVGTGFGDNFLIPYSEKFWTVHPREMTYEWTGNRVPQTSSWHVLRGAIVNRQTKVGSNAVFQYPEHKPGYGAISDAMAGSCGHIHLGHRAVSIDTHQRCIHFENNERVTYDHLVSTIPLPKLVELVSDVPQEIQEAADSLRCNSIFVVNLGIDRPNITSKHWIHFPEPDISFFRISFPHTFAVNMAPAGMSSISTEVAYSQTKPLDKTDIVDRVIDDLIRVQVLNPEDRNRVVVKTTMDIPFGYVIYDTNRREAVRALHHWLNQMDVYPTGRYGNWAYLWSHEAMLAGRNTAERISKNVSSNGR